MFRKNNPPPSGANPPAARAQTAVRHLVADAALWLGVLAALQGFRAVLLWLFRFEMSAESRRGRGFRIRPR